MCPCLIRSLPMFIFLKISYEMLRSYYLSSVLFVFLVSLFGSQAVSQCFSSYVFMTYVCVIYWSLFTHSSVSFHFLWKIQSDVWGLLLSSWVGKIRHIVSDFSVNSVTINGWLRNFLWSQAAQVIQSYGTAISSYSLIFIFAHFIWAFSLMFLYSGRGYWQELIESILWTHQKLEIITRIQPRALSISSGRAVGLIHYILGGFHNWIRSII